MKGEVDPVRSKSKNDNHRLMWVILAIMISLTLVSRTVYPVVPSKTEYALTPLGQTFLPVLHAMCAWGQAYLDRADVDCSAE